MVPVLTIGVPTAILLAVPRIRFTLGILALGACSPAATAPSAAPQSVVVAAAAPPSQPVDVPEPEPPALLPPPPCPTRCEGGAPRELVTILMEISQEDGRKCYEQALRRDRSLRGRMMVALVVQSSGQICGVRIANDELGDMQLADCITNVYSERNVPEPSGDCVVVHVPLNLTPKDADAGP